MKSDATRFLRDGVLTVAYEVGEAPALARIVQKPDGKLDARIESAEPDEALAKLRFILAADDDHGEFLHRFRDDPLIGNAVKTLRGMRPIRTATVVHSLLKAVCGQLIESKAARLLEARLVRLASPEHEGLRLPPQRDTFQRFTRADLAAPRSRLAQGLGAPPAHEGARPRAAPRCLDGSGCAENRARARARPVVGRNDLPLRARPLRVRPRRRPRARQARLGASAAAGSRPRRRASYSSPTESGPGSRASTCCSA